MFQAWACPWAHTAVAGSWASARRSARAIAAEWDARGRPGPAAVATAAIAWAERRADAHDPATAVLAYGTPTPGTRWRTRTHTNWRAFRALGAGFARQFV